MDTITKKERSALMAKIKSKRNASTEKRFVFVLEQNDISGWLRDVKLPGKPDIIFSDKKIAVFVDGCFWHDCHKHCRIPSSNRDYWIEKIKGNSLRDRKNTRKLKKMGWSVIRVWEHELKENHFRLDLKIAYLKILLKLKSL